jgi:hypothetical protein
MQRRYLARYRQPRIRCGGRKLTRANHFAHADVRDPRQPQVLESYLLNPQISPAEMNAFVGIYRNANFMISTQPANAHARPQYVGEPRRGVTVTGSGMAGRSALREATSGIGEGEIATRGIRMAGTFKMRPLQTLNSRRSSNFAWLKLRIGGVLSPKP